VRYDAYNNPVGVTGTANFDTTGIASSLREGRLKDDGSTDRATVNGGGTGASYVVQRYDTLRGIARAAYGDETLWYLIAEANALPGNVTPPAGTVIQLPAVTRSSNSASTFAVYNPADAIGDTSPAQIEPPPPPAQGGKGCGGVGMILMVVVAVVATIVTAGAAALVFAGQAVTMGTVFSAGLTALAGGGLVAGTGITIGVGAAIGGAAVGGAIGSIASQAVGIATGVQDEFNWKSVGLSALGAAVTSGIGAMSGGISAAQSGSGNFLGISQKGNPLLYAAARGATNSHVTQGLGSALGLQSFEWKAIAVSAITSPLNAGINDGISSVAGSALRGMGETFSSGVLGVINGATAQAVRMQVYSDGKIDWASIASDAFGNALGNGIVETLQDSALPVEIQGMPRHARDDAHALASNHELDLDSDRDQSWLIDAVKLRNEPWTISDNRRQELVNEAIDRARLSEKSAEEVRVVLRNGGLLDAPEAAVDNDPSVIRFPRVEVRGKAGAAFEPALGAFQADGMAISAGDVAKYVYSNIKERPWLQTALTVLDVAAGPVAWSVREVISATVIGEKLAEAQEFVQETISGRFSAVGYEDDQAFSGGLGAMLVLGVAAGGTQRALASIGNVLTKARRHGAFGRLGQTYVKELGLADGTLISTRPSTSVNKRLYADAWDANAGRLHYRDPATGEWKAVSFSDPLQRDHILSQRQAVDLLKQYGVTNKGDVERILTWDDNFQLLPRSINSSKGDRMGLAWTSYKGEDGVRIDIPLEQQVALQRRQTAIRADMQQWLESQGYKSNGGRR
jgi:hypothetical protein